MSDDQATMKLRRVRWLLIGGMSPKHVARATGIDADAADQEKARLREAGILPFDESKLYTVSAMASLLGVLPRRVRLICQQGRLGMKVAGQLYLIRGDEMREFLRRDRPRGGAGIRARREEEGEGQAPAKPRTRKRGGRTLKPVGR